MGLKVFKITGERQAVVLVCDCSAHGDCVRTAWFDCSSRSGSLFLAKAVGWIERQGAPGVWLCPRCAQGRDQEAGIALNRQPVGSPPVSQTHPGRPPGRGIATDQPVDSAESAPPQPMDDQPPHRPATNYRVTRHLRVSRGSANSDDNVDFSDRCERRGYPARNRTRG